jgi:hypothetical protein
MDNLLILVIQKFILILLASIIQKLPIHNFSLLTMDPKLFILQMVLTQEPIRGWVLVEHEARVFRVSRAPPGLPQLSATKK